jgi:hypothetical protein
MGSSVANEAQGPNGGRSAVRTTVDGPIEHDGLLPFSYFDSTQEQADEGKRIVSTVRRVAFSKSG